jgi:hypothetical protein
MFLHERERARARGDRGVERCMNVELRRMGYREPALETVVPEPLVEQAIPDPPKKGRRPKPRCEHEQIADRCVECNPELAV